MAVYTEVGEDELDAFVAGYDIGAVRACKGIAEGVENSNFLLHTDAGYFILTLYEKRVDPADLPFFIGLMEHLSARGISCPTPVKTRAGWLALYHGVATHFASANIYQAGVMLLDLQNPCKLLARSRYNILEPRESWELTGQVPNVVFPSGLVVEAYDDQGFARFDSPFRLYYGAADTAVGLVTGRVADLIEAATA